MPQEKRTGGGVAGSFLGFIGLSVAAGILITAAVTPALAVTGMTAKGAIDVFDSLPGFLEIDPPMERSVIAATAADGSTQQLAAFFDQNRQQVGWDDVSQYFKDAAVSAEDPRFYEHGGIDIMGTTRGVLKTAVGGDTQGGSSITQQYVKNVLTQKAEKILDKGERDAAYNEAVVTTPERKLREMRYAINVEKKYSKDEILLGYLNIANFGGVSYGVETASQYYFGVSARDVNIEQAATLIALVNNPNNLRIDRPDSEYSGAANGYKPTLDRRNYVIKKMYEHGKITLEQRDAALAAPITPNIVQPTTGCHSAGNAAFFCNYVQRTILNDPKFGNTPEERAAALRRGGMTIFTTVDLDVQNAAQAAMDQYIPKDRTNVNLGAAAVTVQPNTGRVLSMVQNKIFSEDQAQIETSPAYSSINYNTDYAYGGSSGFPVGSTYKVFVLLDWLKNGHSVNETVDATRKTRSRWTASCEPGGVHVSQPWNPKNYDGNASGRITPYDATKRSVNTAFVDMTSKLDLCSIANTAEDMGVHKADGGKLEHNPASVLGSGNTIAPLSMATAIAGIGAGGMTCSPIAIDKIIGPDGNEMPVPESNCSRGVTPEVANTATYAMQSVFGPGGTAANARVGGAPLYGKTGTSDDAYDTWITGGTTEAVTSFWIGNTKGMDGTGRKTSMYNVSVNGTTAFQSKFRIFAQIAAATISKYGGKEFPGPSDSLTKRKQIDVPDVVGKTVEEATKILSDAGFNVEVGEPILSTVPAGRVAGTDPAAGTSVTSGNTITIRPSDGAGQSIPDVVGMSPDKAKATLEGIGFSKVDQKCLANPEAPDGDGKVTEQVPAAGSIGKTKDATATITFTKQSC